MSPDEEIFAEALLLPAADRGEYLRRVCAGDENCVDRINALLCGHDRAGGFLRVPLAVSGSATAPEAPLGQIGRYHLLEKIGEGGCGIVYLAEQQEPVRRRVALKLIKVGMDTNAVVARFDAERQAVAMMDHPNIAKVFDAGATETGRPYFVMELVHGIAITKYCDQNHLALRQRLELFILVCAALQHAHQKGIVHRDLKPSNILIAESDGTPVPKVIDFGVAKATQGRLTEHILYTNIEQFIGTPAYMSPEQAEMSGLDVDARSDIYTLGILLYELLAGSPPYDSHTFATAGVDEIRRQIREVDPPRPSTRVRTLTGADRAMIAKFRAVPPTELALLLRGDLDWIVMRCLEKDRARRYSTAQDLGADLQRHLDFRPVHARPRSPAYVLGKFIRRSRTGLAMAGVVVAAVAVGAWSWIRAERAERAPAGVALSAAAGPAAQAHQLSRRAFALCSPDTSFLPADLNVAEDLARKATDLDPTSARAWGVRAWVEAAYLNRNWDQSPARREAAQNFANHALTLDPNEPEALNAEAQVLLVQQAYTAAEALARRAVAAAPRNIRSWLILGEALGVQARKQEHLQTLQEALRLNPDSLLIHYDLMRYYSGYSNWHMSGPDLNFAAALAECREILRIKPFASALVILAWIELQKLGDLKAARAALDQLDHMPLSDRAEDRAVYVAALCGLEERRPDRTLAAAALTAHTYFHDLTIASPKAWLRAFAQQEAGHPNLAHAEWEKAESLLRQKVREDPNAPDDFATQLADTLAWLGRKEEAAQWVAPLLSAYHDEPTELRACDLAHYYSALGDVPDTLYYLQRSIRGWGEMEYDPWWDKVRGSPEIQRFTSELKARTLAEMRPGEK